MAGLTTAFSMTTLDAAIVATDVVAWSENGTTESAVLAATAIAAWDASTNADPAVRSNTSAVDSAAASGGCTISHFAVYNSGKTVQKTDWTALTASRTLVTGDKLSVAANAIAVTLT